VPDNGVKYYDKEPDEVFLCHSGQRLAHQTDDFLSLHIHGVGSKKFGHSLIHCRDHKEKI